jgi:hypothetical protein
MAALVIYCQHHNAVPTQLLFMLTAPLVVRLPPPLEALRYEVAACWETYANGDYRTSTITKQVALSGRVVTDGTYELHFETSPPVLTKPEDPEPLEVLALRLAALYERVVVRATPTGRFVALLNHDNILDTWHLLAKDLRESTIAEDQITATLIQFMSQQLQDPANFLHSLRHDYFYHALVPDFYAQPLDGPTQPVRMQKFSQFFDKQPLWFLERIEVLPTAPDEALTLLLRGTLDYQKTDVAAIGKLMAAAVGAAADPAAVPHFHYEATHVLDRQTGLPQRVELTVYGRLADVYNKEYNLTISCL